jgi:hypothetical protein
MTKMVLLDVRLFAGGADLSGNSNKAEITAEFEDKDATNYRSGGWKEVLAGLASSTINAEGQWEAGDPGKVDDASWAQLGGIAPWTVCPTDSTVGTLAYFTNALRSSYKLGDQVGEIAPWTGKASGSWPWSAGRSRTRRHRPHRHRHGHLDPARCDPGREAPVRRGARPVGGRHLRTHHHRPGRVRQRHRLPQPGHHG